MAEPLGIGAGVVGVLGFALQLTVAELGHLKGVLESLASYLSSENSRRFEQNSTLYAAASQCILKLQSLHCKLKHATAGGDKFRRALMRVSWPLDNKEHQRMLLELQRYTQLFQLAMTIEGCKLLSETSGNISQTLHEHLRALGVLKSLSADAARDSTGLSRQVTELLQTFESIPDSTDEVAKTFESVQRLEVKWDEFKDLERFNEALASKRRREKNSRRLLKLLSSIDYEWKHRKLRKTCHKGTGSWIVDTEPFNNWTGGPSSSCLYCYGIPGAGKTILTSSIVDILNQRITDQKTAIAYYYCDYSDQGSLEISAVLGTIIKQLLQRITEIPENIGEQLSRSYENTRTPDAGVLNSGLQSALELFSTVYIVVDGVDELGGEEQTIILTILTDLAKLNAPTVKVFISGRREELLVRKPQKNGLLIELSTANIESDIALFVKETVRTKIESEELVIRNLSLEGEIVKALVDGAKGMFIWVQFQIDEICAAQTDAAIRKILQTLPKDLAETYRRILKKISTSTGGTGKAAIAQKMFKWIVCARRPLKIDEIKEAVGIEREDTFWDADKIPTHNEHMVRCGGNLVIFDRDDQTVRLAHHSVQQFLLSEAEKPDGFHFRYQQAGIEVGEICVAYLSFSDFETQITKFKSKMRLPDVKVVEDSIWAQLQVPHVVSRILSYLWRHDKLQTLAEQPPQINFSDFLCHMQRSPLSDNLLEKYRLLGYASENWLLHTGNFSEETTTWRLFRSLAMEKEMQFDHKPWGRNHMPADLPYLALFQWAVHNGHVPLLTLLLKPPTGPDFSHYSRIVIKNDKSHQLLRRVCRQDHVDILSLFFDVDAIEKQSLEDGQLFINAVESRSDRVLKLLLNHGAPPDAKDTDGNPALHVAVMNRCKSTTEALLAHGANVWAWDCFHKTALHWAATNGCDRMVQLLIDKGADVKARDNFGKTALHHAAGGGHASVAQLLINKGADVKAIDMIGRTALHHAAWSGHASVAQLLIQMGADINARANYRETALQKAARMGHDTVVELLMEMGAVNKLRAVWSS